MEIYGFMIAEKGEPNSCSEMRNGTGRQETARAGVEGLCVWQNGKSTQGTTGKRRRVGFEGFVRAEVE